jgi:aryl-alcohol dehydrogenase-like predicted oxidoreductase
MLNERNLGIAGEVTEIAAELGTSPASIALAWAAQQAGITAVIIGPRTIDQLHGSLAAFSLSLPPGTLTRLGQISQPGTLDPIIGMGAHR